MIFSYVCSIFPVTVAAACTVNSLFATAAITSGVTPYYNNIAGQRWLNRETLRPVGCVDDAKHTGLNTTETASPNKLSKSSGRYSVMKGIICGSLTKIVLSPSLRQEDMVRQSKVLKTNAVLCIKLCFIS